MAESQDTQDIQAKAREELLKQIAELAPHTGYGGVKDLAEAYALVVSADAEGPAAVPFVGQ